MLQSPRLYPDSVAIQHFTVDPTGVDTAGGYSTVSGMGALAGRLMGRTNTSAAATFAIYPDATHVLLLRAYLSTIEPKWTVLIGGLRYKILDKATPGARPFNKLILQQVPSTSGGM